MLNACLSVLTEIWASDVRQRMTSEVPNERAVSASDLAKRFFQEPERPDFYRYLSGKHVPVPELIDRVDMSIPGPKKWLEHLAGAVRLKCSQAHLDVALFQVLTLTGLRPSEARYLAHSKMPMSPTALCLEANMDPRDVLALTLHVLRRNLTIGHVPYALLTVKSLRAQFEVVAERYPEFSFELGRFWSSLIDFFPSPDELRLVALPASGDEPHIWAWARWDRSEIASLYSLPNLGPT